MNFNNIQKLIEILLKLFNYCQAHRIVNLVKMGMLMMIFYMLFMEFYVRSRFYDEAKRNNIISAKIGDVVQGCGKHSFVSWVVFEDNKISFQKKKVGFIDVVGCINEKKEHCPVSVKMSNQAYLNTYYLGYDDYNYLINLQDSILVSCEVINREVVCPDYTPQLLNQISKLTNFELSKISYVLVRDFKSNLVYIFTLAFTTNSIPTCTEQVGNSLLENLSRTAKENLDL